MSTDCPTCLDQMNYVCELQIRDFDGSIFNLIEDVFACPVCGFCGVNTGLSDNAIARHYANASMYVALSGVGVGGNTAEDLMRYAHYEQFMRREGCLDSGAVADIGCSRGGFLKYLIAKQPELSLIGIDCDLDSLKQLGEMGIAALPGDISALPLEDETRGTLCYFHVLEHVYDIDCVLREAFRVLKPEGKLLIEVPDAEHYDDPECYVGPMFWAGMKEHVNHFSFASLAHLCERNGFGVAAVSRSFQPMKSGQAYPSLLLLATKGAKTAVGNHSEIHRIRNYFVRELDAAKWVAARVAQSVAKVDQVTFWGIGVEFFALYPFFMSQLVGRRLRLIDSNPAKVGQTVDGISVSHPDLVTTDGVLVCCSYMSSREIVAAAIRKGWPDDRIIDIAQIARLPGVL